MKFYINNILCKLLNHKAVRDESHSFYITNGEKTCSGYCSRCNKKLFCWYNQGKLSKEWFWTEVAVEDDEKIIRDKKIQKILK